MSEVRIAPLYDQALAEHLPELARLRIAVFRAFPYLYDGSPDYEARYLERYAATPGSVIIGAFAGSRLVGAATALPMTAEPASVTEPLAHAGLVVRSALFRLPVRNRPEIVPWVTYTDPELAQAGLTEAQARERHGKVEVAQFGFAENDRARAELRTEGLVKAVIGRRGRILGCSIVGADAGALIQPWALALSKGLSIGDMAGHVAPYPTLGEVSKSVAGAYFAPRLVGSRAVRLIVRLLARLG